MRKFFDVSASKYDAKKDFHVYRPASLNNPHDNAVMFVTEGYVQYADVLKNCVDCIVYWPVNFEVPDEIKNNHAVILSDNPHTAFCRFFAENMISNLPQKETYECVGGAYISPNAVIGKGCTIFPGAFIGGYVTLGDNVYIGSGAKLLGTIKVGNNVVIRENAVLGADGLTTDRDENGRALTMPQFGGIVIEDDVQIGALTVIGRGAIDNTVIKRGSKIDNSCFISHNVVVGEDTFIVGETIMFGSSSTGSQAYISGNATIRDGRHIGDRGKVGMGAVVTRNVDDDTLVKGNPAK